MKKIMFNDRYGLTKAVLEGRKTMTRRSISEDVLQRADVYRHKYYEDTLGLLPWKKALIEVSPFNVGEVVAVAQSYEDISLSFIYPPDKQWGVTEEMRGYSNKMFVRADLMPHQIRITNVRVERLQDISNEDCIKEGIGKNSDIVNYSSPRQAFAALIDKVSGKGTWESNPWVFVYEFELVK